MALPFGSMLLVAAMTATRAAALRVSVQPIACCWSHTWPIPQRRWSWDLSNSSLQCVTVSRHGNWVTGKLPGSYGSFCLELRWQTNTMSMYEECLIMQWYAMLNMYFVFKGYRQCTVYQAPPNSKFKIDCIGSANLPNVPLSNRSSKFGTTKFRDWPSFPFPCKGCQPSFVCFPSGPFWEFLPEKRRLQTQKFHQISRSTLASRTWENPHSLQPNRECIPGDNADMLMPISMANMIILTMRCWAWGTLELQNGRMKK